MINQNHSLNQKNFNKERFLKVGYLLLVGIFILSVCAPAARAQGEVYPAPETANGEEVAPDAPLAPDTPILSNSVFGVQMFPINTSGGLGWVNNTFTRWTRGPEIIWKDVEATKGVYNWSAIDKAVADIQAAASLNNSPTSVIVVVRSTPAWAQANPPYSCGPIKPSEYQSFGNFMFGLIDNLASRGITYVKYWELWNEPDNPPISTSDPDQPMGGCWGNPSDLQYFGGQAYGEMLKKAYPKIKSIDGNAQVLVGGLNLDCNPNNPPAGKDCLSSRFLEGILQTGGGDYFDGVSFHAFDYFEQDQDGDYLLGQYSNPNWPGSAWNDKGPSLIQKARFIKSVLTKYGKSSKFLMNTENSLITNAWYTTDPNNYDPILERTKSYYVAQAYAAAYAEGLRANIWFDVTGSWLRNNGLIKLDASDVLDAFTAYNFASTNAGNTLVHTSFKYFNPLSFPGVTGYEFGATPTNTAYPPYHIWILWSKDGEVHNLQLPTMTPQVYDVKGNTVATNVTTLPITLQPYYIIMNPYVPRLRLPIIGKLPFNGDFEMQFTNWTIADNGLPSSLQTTNPKDPQDPTGNTLDTDVPIGTTSALLGDPTLGFGQAKGVCSFTGVPAQKFAAINRTVYVTPPPTGASVYLSFKYIIYSQDTTGFKGSVKYDQFEVWFSDGINPPFQAFTDGNTAFQNSEQCRWYRVPSVLNPRAGATTGWVTKTILLDNWKGQLLGIQFQNYNGPDGWFNTYTYLDDVKIIFGPQAAQPESTQP